MGIYTIYKLTNKKNGNSYIGKTKDIEKRIEQHKELSDSNSSNYIHNAIRKYGFDNFNIEIIFQSTSKLISEKEFTNTFEPLLIREHKSHYTENGYNMTWGGEGLDSNSASVLATKRVKKGNHNFMRRNDGTSATADRVKNGTHNWLKRYDGSSVTADKVKNGTHPFMKDKNGVSLAQRRVENGTHNLTDSVTCYDVDGKSHQIPKEIYYSQTGPMETWKFVHNQSYEGKRRANRTTEIKISCVNLQGKQCMVPKNVYYSQEGPKENWEWVATVSKEGMKRTGKLYNFGITSINKLGKIKNIPKDVYYSQEGPKENWEWVNTKSKEAKSRLSP